MRLRVVITVICIFIFLQNVVGGPSGLSRQKRSSCIVIQKQSGTRGDSAESDGDDDYRRPQPKEPMPDRFRKPVDRNLDSEDIPPELQRFKNRFDRLRQKQPNRYVNQKEKLGNSRTG